LPGFEKRREYGSAVGSPDQNHAITFADNGRTRRVGEHVAITAVDLDDEEGASGLPLDGGDGHADGWALRRGSNHFEFDAEIMQHALKAMRALQALNQARRFLVQDQLGNSLGTDVGWQHDFIGACLQQRAGAETRHCALVGEVVDLAAYAYKTPAEQGAYAPSEVDDLGYRNGLPGKLPRL